MSFEATSLKYLENTNADQKFWNTKNSNSVNLETFLYISLCHYFRYRVVTAKMNLKKVLKNGSVSFRFLFWWWPSPKKSAKRPNYFLSNFDVTESDPKAERMAKELKPLTTTKITSNNPLFAQTHWKSIFQPAFGMCSTQTPVKVG